MAIDDEPKRAFGPITAVPMATYDPYSSSHNSSAPQQFYQPPHHPPPPIHSHSLDGSSSAPLLAPRYGGSGGGTFSAPSSPSHQTFSAFSHSSPHAYDYPASATAGEVMPSTSPGRAPQQYPFHTQGERSYPVPEI